MEIPVSITAIRLEESDHGTLILGIMKDLRGDVELKTQLIEAQIQLRSTLDAMDEAIITVDKGLNIVSWNKRVCALLGENYIDLTGKKCFEVLGGKLGFCCARHIERAEMTIECHSLCDVFKTGKQYTRHFTIKNRETSHWEQRIYPIFDISGEVMQAVILFRDVTEEVRRQTDIEQMNSELQQLYKDAEAKNKDLERLLRELKEAQAHLIQSEKMASIGQLSAGIAHEINNPVGFISSNLKTMRDYVDDMETFTQKALEVLDAVRNQCAQKVEGIETLLESVEELKEELDLGFILEDIKQLVEQSMEGTDRVKRIVSDLKEFSHGGSQEIEYADINKCLESTLNIVWNELKYKAEVKKDYGDLPLVPCFPQKLNQVFMNILVNAAQAIEKKGEIRVCTRHVKAPREGVEIVFEDTGKGMTDEVKGRIFEPFFTTKPVGKGTGLGLHVGYKIIKAHKGEIKVDSEPGKGTRFTVFLPILSEEELDRQGDENGKGA